MGRSGRNILSKNRKSKNTKVDNLYNASLSQRVACYWNKLPSHVKSSTDVHSFKINLEQYKVDNLDKNGYFWEVSDKVLNRIEGASYVENKNKQNEYLKNNPDVAIRKGINLFGS